MKNTTIRVALVALLVVVALETFRSSSVAAPAQPAKAPATKIAVVDLEGVLKRYAKRVTLGESLEKKKQAVMAELIRRRAVMNNLAKSIADLNKGDDDWFKQTEKLETLNVALKAYSRREEYKLLNQAKLADSKSHQEVLAEIKKYAAENQIKLVLWNESPALDTRQTQRWPVLYSAKPLNITDAIVNRLNKVNEGN